MTAVLTNQFKIAEKLCRHEYLVKSKNAVTPCNAATRQAQALSFLEVINKAIDSHVLRVKRHLSFKLEEVYLILSCNSFPKSWGCPRSLVCQVFHHTVLWKSTAEVDQAQRANRGTDVPWRSIHPSIPLQRVMNHLFPSKVNVVYTEFSNTLPYR